MDLLQAVFISPLANMASNPEFVLEVVIGGLLAGVMYSLVALGFVLIFKASGVFNFAQGTMVLFAALTFVGLLERGAPVWGAFAFAAAVHGPAASGSDEVASFRSTCGTCTPPGRGWTTSF